MEIDEHYQITNFEWEHQIGQKQNLKFELLRWISQRRDLFFLVHSGIGKFLDSLCNCGMLEVL